VKKAVVSAIVGSLLGIIGSRYLFVGSALSLIPWTIAGLAIGAWSEKRASMVNGAVYGFTLSFVFMIAGYTGTASLLSRLPFFALLGLFGALCGFVLGILGSLLKVGIRKLIGKDEDAGNRIRGGNA
jgi:hypothetical protein